MRFSVVLFWLFLVVPAFAQLSTSLPRPWEDAQFRDRFTFTFGAKSEVEPTISREEEQVLNQIVDFLEADQLDRAISHLRGQLTARSSAAMDFTLGNLWWLQENWSEAERAYRQALRKFPDFLRAHRHLALTLLQKEEYEEAIEHLARTHQLGGIDAQTFGLLGYAHGQLSRHQSAARAYEMALTLEPDSRPWQTGLIQAYLQMNRTSEVAGMLVDLRQSEPENPDFLRLQANTYLQQGEEANAAAVMELLLLLGNEDSTLLLTLANLHNNRGLADRAVELYLQAHATYGTSTVPALARAGQFLLQQNHPEKAQRLLQQILHRDEALPSELRPSITRLEAELAKNRGDYDKATELFLSLRKIHPRSAPIHLALADLAQRTGERDAAEIHFDRALSDPEPAERAIAHMRFAEFLANQGRWSEALRQADQALAINNRQAWQDYRNALLQRAESP